MSKNKIGLSFLIIVFIFTAGLIDVTHSIHPRLEEEILDNNKSPKQISAHSSVNPKYVSEDDPADISKMIVVKLSQGTDPDEIANSVKAEIVRKGPLQFITLALPEGQTDSLVNQLRKTPGVLSVSPVRIYKKALDKTKSISVSDFLYTGQWGLAKAEVPKAWDLGVAGKGVTVAVVDTGVDLNHPDLKDNLLSGYNAIAGTEGSEAEQDRNGHGTHVSGIIAAGLNNTGIVGVAYQAKILPVKVMNREGEGTNDCIADGIVWSADHGARIINLSLGSESEEEVLKEAIQYAANKGCLIVAAAGNTGDSKQTAMFYPASDPNVLAVTATDSNDQIASFSLTGPQAALAAPGVNIISDYWDGTSNYATIDGTSMASPFVAGVAALVWSAHPELSAQQVRIDLENSALKLGSSGRNNSYGFGRVDAYWALRLADKSKLYSSPAKLDWSGGIVQGGTANTAVTLNIPSRAFGLNPDSEVAVSIAAAADVSDFPAGIQPYGDPVLLQWNGNVVKYIELTLDSTSEKQFDSSHLVYIYHWSGLHWEVIGGGINAPMINIGITEPGIYRIGYILQPENRRIAGSDRLQTAIIISQTLFPNGSDTVLLAKADDFPDALAGAPLAYKVHAPILLTSSDILPAAVNNEIQRLTPQNVILLGGTGAISVEIELQLKKSYTVQRLGGSDRYATAAQIASALGVIGQAVVVNGNNFPDALTVASIAAQQGIPILLADTDNLPSETDTVLRKLSVSATTVVGGEGVISPDILNVLPSPTRLSGSDRYATAAKVLNTYKPQGKNIFLATGENFPDALTGGVLAAFNKSDLVIVPLTGPTLAEESVLRSWHGYKTYVLGGTSVIPDSVQQYIQGIVQ